MIFLCIIIYFLDKKYLIKVNPRKRRNIWITFLSSVKLNIPELEKLTRKYSNNVSRDILLLKKYLRITTYNGLPVTEENFSNVLQDNLILKLKLPDGLSLDFICKFCVIDTSVTMILSTIDESTYDHIIKELVKFSVEELSIKGTFLLYKKEFLKQKEMIHITKKNFLTEFYRDKGNDLWYFYIK